jgi:mRNA interferase HigB
MWIIEERQLKQFWRRFADAKSPLVAWIKELNAARYETPAQVKNRHVSASFVGDKVVFNIGGNKYRLIVRFQYADPTARPPLNGIALVVFIGTHKEYDDIDVGAL